MLSSSNKLQFIYGLSALAGLIFTMYFNVLFIIEHGGFSVVTFVTENYLNNASSSISNDLIIVAWVFLVWSYFEAKRLEMSYWCIYAMSTFCIALAVSLPLFLLMRERYLAHKKASTSN